MNDTENLKEFFENVNTNVEYDLDMKKLKQDLKKSLDTYQKSMRYLVGDMPIAVLCLPKTIERILFNQGFLRIYDLFDVDLVKIKGLGVVRVRHLTSCLDKFFSML